MAESAKTSAAPADSVRFSLRFKLTTGLILIIVIVFAGLNTFNLLSHRETRFAEAANNSRTVASLLAGSLITQLADYELASPYMSTFLGNFEQSAFKLSDDLAFLMVLDAKGELVTGRARPELVVVGERRFESEQAVLSWLSQSSGAVSGKHLEVSRIGLVEPGGARVGTLLVGTSLRRARSAWRQDLILNIAVFGLALLVVVIYGSAALERMVVRPLRRMVDSMLEVRHGKLDNDVALERSDEIGVLANAYNYMLQGLRDRERLKDAFSRYVSRQVYEKFQMGEIKLEGESRHATVLFSDIRSFTSLSEQLQPEEVVSMLNEYFNEMVEIIFKYDGFLNKFIGDAIMAIYNAPLSQSSPELRAVRTGLEMVQALERLNSVDQARGELLIISGIEINTDPVIAGNIGHEKRLEYTVIGDAVNLAQRIESQTKEAGASLLISETTYQAVADHVQATQLAPVKVKGKAQEINLYAVTGLRQQLLDQREPAGTSPAAAGA